VTQISCALADKIQAELVVFESIADLATSWRNQGHGLPGL
jgi:hypothetical protein